ncbi:MAG: hypothetical protein AB7K24_28580 [Gemmataceae bacterium]
MLAAVIAKPDADILRLIYADFLEEGGPMGVGMGSAACLSELVRQRYSGSGAAGAFAPGGDRRRPARQRRTVWLAGRGIRFPTCRGLSKMGPSHLSWSSHAKEPRPR